MSKYTIEPLNDGKVLLHSPLGGVSWVIDEKLSPLSHIEAELNRLAEQPHCTTAERAMLDRQIINDRDEIKTQRDAAVSLLSELADAIKRLPATDGCVIGLVHFLGRIDRILSAAPALAETPADIARASLKADGVLEASRPTMLEAAKAALEWLLSESGGLRTNHPLVIATNDLANAIKQQGQCSDPACQCDAHKRVAS